MRTEKPGEDRRLGLRTARPRWRAPFLAWPAAGRGAGVSERPAREVAGSGTAFDGHFCAAEGSWGSAAHLLCPPGPASGVRDRPPNPHSGSRWETRVPSATLLSFASRDPCSRPTCARIPPPGARSGLRALGVFEGVLGVGDNDLHVRGGGKGGGLAGPCRASSCVTARAQSPGRCPKLMD
jgi:hypothetical protein